jgi:hypothetical protein
MNPLLLSGIFDIGKNLIERFFPDPAQKAAAALELARMQQNGELAQLAADTDLAKLQIQTNIEEAKSTNWFVSGWRPAVGWTCAGGLFYQIIARPIFGWVMQNLFGWTLPPSLEMDTLMTVLFGMLGLGAMRSVEKVKNVEGNR